MWLRSLTACLAIIASGCSGESHEPEGVAFVPLPACEMDGYDECIVQRGLNIRPLLVRSESDTPLRDAFSFACEKGDAEACFFWAGFLEGRRGFLSDFPIDIAETIPDDPDQSLEFYRKSCELNSINGCAAVSLALVGSEEAFPSEPPSVHLEAARAILKSCQLGNTIGCELVSYYASFVDAETWPDGSLSFYMDVADIAGELCASGELYDCHEQAIYLHWASQESGQSELAERADSIVRLNCQNGYEESCSIAAQLDSNP